MEIDLRIKMRVEENLNGSSGRVIRLVLDRADLGSWMDTNNPAPLEATTKKGERFLLYSHPYTSSESFRQHPSRRFYYAYLGNASVKGVEGLAKLINERGARIPVLNGNPNGNGYSNGTYVQLVVEMGTDEQQSS